MVKSTRALRPALTGAGRRPRKFLERQEEADGLSHRGANGRAIATLADLKSEELRLGQRCVDVRGGGVSTLEGARVGRKGEVLCARAVE